MKRWMGTIAILEFLATGVAAAQANACPTASRSATKKMKKTAA